MGKGRDSRYNKINLINKILGFKPSPLQGISGERVGKKYYFSGGCDFQNKFCNSETFILDLKIFKWKKLSEFKK